MNPLIKEYLSSKYGPNYEKEQEAAFEAAKGRANLGNLFGDLGDVVAGRQIGSTDAYFQNALAEAEKNTVGKAKNAKKEFLEDYTLNKTLEDDQMKKDAASEGSKFAQKTLVDMGFDPNLVQGKSVAELESLSPYIKMVIDKKKQEQEFAFKQQENALKRQENAIKQAQAAENKNILQELKIEEKQNQLQTPFGLAQTPDDAKQLKSAAEEKANFDRKIQELIDLRKQFGGETMNREAVARGKQLSKDLLLAYKNMAKLGVLSQSDEAIINAIIPPDPLEFRSPIAAMQGQDPVLNNLQKFKSDAEADFQTKLMNRLRQPGQSVKDAVTPETKEINGVMYEKVNGGWQKVKKDAAR